jgi:hypothetical protein
MAELTNERAIADILIVEDDPAQIRLIQRGQLDASVYPAWNAPDAET